MEATGNIKYQLSVQRPRLSRFGTFSIENLDIQSLSDIGTQKALKTLIVSNSKISSFSTLPSQPNLEKIFADNCQINSYAGLTRHPRLKNVSFQNTPISRQPNFRLCCIILIGNRLSLINGVPVSNKEKLIASQYPLIARNLIEAGWKFRYPVPTRNEFCRYAHEFKLKLGIDPDLYNENAQKYFRNIPYFISTDDTSSIPKEEEITENEGAKDLELARLLQTILQKKLGVKIDSDFIFDDITNVVRDLSKIVQKLSLEQKEIFGID